MKKIISSAAVVMMVFSAALAQDQVAPGLPRAMNARNFNRGMQAPARVGGGIHKPFAPPVTAQKIRTAIDDAVMFIRNCQREDGSIHTGSYVEGETALAALTLLAAGADPAADEQLQKALDFLAKNQIDNTYVHGIKANVWEYALRKIPGNKTYTEQLKAEFDWLLKALGNKEGWRYQLNSPDWDNSCTQYGVLGIWAAARAGMDPGEKFWQTLSKHFRTCQCDDGGWSYTGRGGSTPNMATAGLASMFLVFDMHHGKSFYSAKNPRTFSAGEAAEVLASIEKGMNWLGKQQQSKEDGYYLYGIERTGVASGRKLIGGEDWFARGALAVLQRQGGDGSINMGSWGGPVGSTSFCTLFLVYGGAPVAFNKLQYGPEHDWNLNPRDLANLSKFLWSAYESPLNWQTVSITGPADDLEAPILFLSGSKAAAFSDEEVNKLRGYILRGGTILAEPSDHSADFAKSVEGLVAKLFPPAEYPSFRLEALPADHGIYTVMKQEWKSRPALRGVSDGSRTFFIISEEYLSADWQMDRQDTDAFKLAMNLLFYATDLGTLQGKFASILPATDPAEIRKDLSMTMARVKYGPAEARSDWDAAAACWQRFGPYIKHITGGELKEAAPVELGKSDLKDIRLLHLTGRHAMSLTAEQQAALKKYVEDGGTVLVDAYAGAGDFAGSARPALEGMFQKLVPLPADHALADGRFKAGQDLSHGIGFKLVARQRLRDRGEKAEGQKLLVAMQGKRPAVIYSEYDLVSSMAGIENYRSLGYKPASARKIVGNLVAYLMAD